jgi:putative OPT family oligopeptide transporter
MSSQTAPDAPAKPPAGAADFTPYTPASEKPPEFTLPAVLAGTLLGLVFGASSLYLVLKVGMTVSASIPVAVLSITLFRALSTAFGLRRATILENNITQTAGSAGESIAFGVGVTMPALMMLGFDMDIGRIMLVSVLGGVLGILMMIPLRRAFIDRLHGKLIYPEGTACAQVLISGDKGGSGGQTVFVGFGVAFVHQILTGAVGLFRDAAAAPLSFFNRAASVGIAMESALLGVGYIIGLRTAAVLMAGAVLGYLVIVPAIATFGDLATADKLAPGSKLIRDMTVGEIRNNYMLYIGAGCVAAAGIISMFKTLPMIVRSLAGGLAGLRDGGGKAAAADDLPRTDRDLPMGFVFGGSAALLAALALFLVQDVGPAAAITGAGLILLFGFLFVTVSSRLTGEIGSSSNPISGMTVATLSLTCLIFLGLGWTTPSDRVLALSVAAVVCIAASNGGTTSQDLKTGFLVGGTPKWQQWAIIVGALSSALVLGAMLAFFNQAGTVYTADRATFPQLRPELREEAGRTVVGGAGRSFFRVADDAPGLRNGVMILDKEGRVTQLKGFDPEVIYSGTETHAGTTYRVWHPGRHFKGLFANLGSGKYLVDAGDRLAFYVDPAITGKLTERDDGSKVVMKFDAPKTQVMGVIINGVLGRELNWGLVLMGAMIAVALELCGVSSLAFAVGVYIPTAYSVPIFLGGIVRWVVDNWLTRGTAAEGADAAAIAHAETSPGVLLSSGYIAGGSLAGVAIAFLEFDLLKVVKDNINVAGALQGGTWDSDVPALVAFGLLALLPAAAGFLFGRPPTPIAFRVGGDPAGGGGGSERSGATEKRDE